MIYVNFQKVIKVVYIFYTILCIAHISKNSSIIIYLFSLFLKMHYLLTVNL